jgi:hypothetical protein
MTDPYTWQMKLDEEEKNSANRLLRKLRMVLFALILGFLVTMIWFSLSA